MSPRLLMLETRRNVGPWFVPVILLVSWWLLSVWGWIAILWSSTNEELQASVIPFAAPAMAGAAAWMAGRERRRGTEDLLASVPRSPVTRGVTLWAATAFWGMLAYAIVAAYMTGRTALLATWGGPEVWRIIIVLAAILAASAWGVFFGSLVPSRLTAAVVAISALGLQMFLSNYSVPTGGGSSPSWVNYLAPDKTTFDLAPWQTLIYLGITSAGLAALAVRRREGIAAWPALAISAALVLAGVVMVWGSWLRVDLATGVAYNGWGQPIELHAAGQEPDPVCAGFPVTVCVHPQYQPLLTEAAASANRLAKPLLGLPGVPLSAVGRNVSFTGGGTSSPLEVGDQASLDVSHFADTLVADPDATRYGSIVNEAQLALRSWLLQQADIESYLRCDDPRSRLPEDLQSQLTGPPGMPTRLACEAADRFAGLPHAEQRAWLETHYAALRAGSLDLSDLP